MTVLSHLGHRSASIPLGRPLRVPRVRPVAAPRPARVDAVGRETLDERVYAVQRLGAVSVGLFLLAFGVVGLTSGLPFLTAHGQRIAGLSSDGLLSVLSVVVAAILLGAAARGPRVASTVMMALGALFLLSALAGLAVLGSSVNLLAFQVSDVLFSVVVGLLLLVLGAYGRVSGSLPADSPYARPHVSAAEPPQFPSTAEEVAAEAAMREAEIRVVQHIASEDQRRRVRAMAGVRTRADRRRTWMEFDQRSTGEMSG